MFTEINRNRVDTDPDNEAEMKTELKRMIDGLLNRKGRMTPGKELHTEGSLERNLSGFTSKAA